MAKLFLNQNQRELIRFMSKYCADMNEANRLKIWKCPKENLLKYDPINNKSDRNLFKSIVLK